MFIEVLTKDDKSGLVNELDVVSIQPNLSDDKALVAMRGIDPVTKRQITFCSAMSYDGLKRRLTAQTVSIAMEDDTIEETGEFQTKEKPC